MEIWTKDRTVQKDALKKQCQWKEDSEDNIKLGITMMKKIKEENEDGEDR